MAPPGSAWERSASADGGGPTAFGPSTGSGRMDRASQLDGEDVVPPRGSRRWWPDESISPPSEKVRKEVLSLISRQPVANSFSHWQMNFPFDLPCGLSNPVCALGECGDTNCPAYRPKHPEVREAVERTIVEKSLAHFRGDTELRTYASVGSGLLAQDWLILERLRNHGLLPRRAIFVDFKTARPLISCEGGEFPRPTPSGGLNLRQTGFHSPLGPEFSFSADITFEEPTRPSVLFNFCNGSGNDAIFVEVGGPDHPGQLVFGVSCGTNRQTLQVNDCWRAEPEEHTYVFTVSATGVLRVYVDQRLVSMGMRQAPNAIVRKHLHVGQSYLPNSSFSGKISKVKVWGHEIDSWVPDGHFESETKRATQQFTQWYSDEISVWTFGSLASYAAAAEKDPRFAADLLVRVDVHEELDGYDDFCCQALSKHGMSLTLGGPGRSWCRSGGGWCLVNTNCPVLDAAEKKARAPWATSLSLCTSSEFCTDADLVRGSAWCRSRRLQGRRRPHAHTRRKAGDKATHCLVGNAGEQPGPEERDSSEDEADDEGEWPDVISRPPERPPTSPKQVRCSPDLSQWEFCSRPQGAKDPGPRGQRAFAWQRTGDDFEWGPPPEPKAPPPGRRVSWGREQVISPAASAGESGEEPAPPERPALLERRKPCFCRRPTCLPSSGGCCLPGAAGRGCFKKQGAGGQPPVARASVEMERLDLGDTSEDDAVPTLDELLDGLDSDTDDKG